jgi:competence protein ComEC
MKNLNNKLLLFIFTLLCIFNLNLITSYSNKDFIVFIDVGQGDATLICTINNGCGLIDTGKSLVILDKIKNYTNKPLKFLLLTHADFDHTGRALDILKMIGFEKVFITKSDKSKAIIDGISGFKVPVFELRSKNDFYFGDYFFDIIWPKEDLNPNILPSNEISTSILISNQGKTLFLAGDLGTKLEEELLEKHKFSNIDINKISHHGSKNSSSLRFLKEIHSNLAIISVGKNSYGHPSKQVTDKLSSIELKYLRTDVDGDIKILISNGNIQVETQKSKKSYIILN